MKERYQIKRSHHVKMVLSRVVTCSNRRCDISVWLSNLLGALSMIIHTHTQRHHHQQVEDVNSKTD